ncbi:LLM class flavin-dependent oxidoreductase [Nocardia acidivorans]|uniref:LLM class flavin-dependent oxidoreductase n=1 Tax=Nocardia acidivorans TaxID=404580 RepID=UPI00082DDBB9|nr:LLM class flavin-dependent oxidoreductase [Nocardia acidivorans]
MKFAMISEAQLTDPTPEHKAQVPRDSVEQAVLAVRVEFDTVWAVEHHGLEWYAHMSAPEIFPTWVAARTERIRLGHVVVCMPMGTVPQDACMETIRQWGDKVIPHFRTE